MPAWVNDAFSDYQKRLAHTWPIKLIEIPLLKRSKSGNYKSLMEKEGDKMLVKIPDGSFIITLEIKGKSYTSEQFSQQIKTWQAAHLCFLIGGPEGLSEQCLKRANARWSLSDLTLAHPLVRVMFAEQLYRAWSISQNHPYHK